MRRTVILFLALVLLPAAVLGILAWKTAAEQSTFIEQQESRLRQQEVDKLASQIRLAIFAEYEKFSAAAETALALYPGDLLLAKYPQALESNWNSNCIAFITSPDGRLLAPQVGARPQDKRVIDFLTNNRDFINSGVAEDIYQTIPGAQAELTNNLYIRSGSVSTFKLKSTEKGMITGYRKTTTTQSIPANRGIIISKTGDSSPSRGVVVRRRTVIPQQEPTLPHPQLPPGLPPASNIKPQASTFADSVQSQDRGILARYVDNQLQLFFWLRSEKSPDQVLAAQIDPLVFKPTFEAILESLNPGPNINLQLLNSGGKPITALTTLEKMNWKAPFVATEIGEVLPHWEAALYLLDPDALSRSANWMSIILMGLISTALIAIFMGGGLLISDLRRQRQLALKKSDFVSNVTHELKTPLTSIKLFSELLERQASELTQQSRQYIDVISSESDRLNRLIDQILDFSQLERKSKRYQKESILFDEWLHSVLQTQRARLEENGASLKIEEPLPQLHLLGDPDALSQIIINLLTNAEKYAGPTAEIEIATRVTKHVLELSVLDRGPGVPSGTEEKIFEQFFRAEDSLDSEIPGSGLGLTLARGIARDHGGDLKYQQRTDGGSHFILTLPLENQNS